MKTESPSSSLDESFEELYEDAPCGSLSTLPDGEIIQVNRTFLSWTGYSADELRGIKRFSALLTMPSALLYETHCAPLLRLRGSIGEIALDVLCRDKKPLPVLFSATSKRDAAGAPCLFRIVVLNAPTRREYERELLRARTQAEDAAEQIRIHREQAERKVVEQQSLLKAVERMTAGDLETPVSVELGSSQTQLASSLELMRKDIGAQIRELKARNAEIQHLNVELRHQIEQRSRLMVETMQSGIGTGSSSGMDYSAVEELPILAHGTLLVGRYRVESILGQGAMGTVYEVERTLDGSRFAAKVLSVKPDYKAMARFAREAQLLARLQHPNLISIVDADVTEDRVAYIIMELARGQSLAELGTHYRDHAFMLPVLRQVADALTVVHDAGVVHRDLKPANVLISKSPDGARTVAKLVDFGVSRLLESPQDILDAAAGGRAEDLEVAAGTSSVGLVATVESPLRTATAPTLYAAAISDVPMAPPGRPVSESTLAKGRSRTSDKLTQAGALLGTLLYMAPELRSGSSLAKPPSDIFSFGVMAYEVLTGALPFEEMPLVLASRGTGELPFKPLSALCPGLAPAQAHFLERCLAVDPAYRPTAGELSVALHQAAPVR